ncbi:trigger factor [Candidatus Gracilibacteria bacterium]|nr:trigger factor [Candidatus Gracilibacteria bacterium]
MTDHFKKISGSRVSFSLSIEQKDIDVANKKVLENFQKYTNIKGFRKGQVPLDIIKKEVGEDRLGLEAVQTAIDKKYQNFIKENRLQPTAAPHVNFSDLKKIPIEVKIEVELFPEIDLGNYQKIKLSPIKVEANDKEIDETMETFMKEAGVGVLVDRKSKKGDILEIDFEGKNEKGETIPNTKGEKVSLLLGSGRFLPDLEAAYEGMKAGESKKAVKVGFPKDYPAPDMAGKKIPFDIKVHSVKEISSKNINEELIEKIVGKKKKIDEFRKDISLIVERNKHDQEKQKQIAQYSATLVKTVKIDLPQSWIDREVEGRLQNIKNDPHFKHDPESFWKHIGKKEVDLKKEFEKQAEKDLKVFLALSHIIEKEHVELDKDELHKAELIAHNRLSKNNSGGVDYEEEIQKTILNLKIDKYIDGLML